MKVRVHVFLRDNQRTYDDNQKLRFRIHEIILLRDARIPTPYTPHFLVEPSEQRQCRSLDGFEGPHVMVYFVRDARPWHDHEADIMRCAQSRILVQVFGPKSQQVLQLDIV